MVGTYIYSAINNIQRWEFIMHMLYNNIGQLIWYVWPIWEYNFLWINIATTLFLIKIISSVLGKSGSVAWL